MKNLFFILLLLSTNAYSQQVSWFEAEQSSFYEGTGCKAGSDIEFYAQKGGGKVLKKVKANAQGVYQVQESLQFKPAFVLDRVSKKVRHFENPEFSFGQPSIQSRGGNVEVSWNCEIADKEKISFEVLKSKDGVNYTAVETIAGRSGANTAYLFTEKATSSAAFYKIKINHGAKGVRYTSKMMALDGGAVKVFPTVVTTSVMINLEQLDGSAPYKVISEQGQVVLSGKLDKQQNNISVAALSGGNYFIVVQNGKSRSTARITKL